MREIRAYWQQEDNLGDKLTPYILEKLFHVKPVFSKGTEKLLGVGSILHHAKENDVIWGSGVISPRHLPKGNNLNVLALRGTLTEEQLKKGGREIKDIAYGDPALLLPQIYNPNVGKEYSVGVIPHYVDQAIAEEKYKSKAKIINVALPIEEFIDEVNKCEFIYSSSLHGLVVADAYNIPNERVVLSNKLVGGDFKFNDYYSGRTLFKAGELVRALSDYLETK